MKKWSILIFCFLLNSTLSYGWIADNDLLISNNTISRMLITNSETSSNQNQLREYVEKAVFYTKNGDTKNAAIYIDKYIKESLEVGFLDSDRFLSIRNSDAYMALSKKYHLNFSGLNLFYLFSSLIGIFIAIILIVKRSNSRRSNALISAFVLIHSIFILHIFLYQSNLKFQFPEILFMSTIFSFLYGPLIYFYFKKTIEQYRFKMSDMLHLIPTLVIINVLFPVLSLSANQKLEIMYGVGVVDTAPYVLYIFTAKLLSLLIYGYLLVRVCLKNLKMNTKISAKAIRWKKNIVALGVGYVLSYAVYGLIIIEAIPRIEFLYHLQVVAMAVMVLYIGFTAYLNPSLFLHNLYKRQINKYKKSGLTSRYSEELKEGLIYLLDIEKIYKQSDISLEKLSQKMGTTRHSASQVINEHFQLNFFELINRYRIEEASEILKNDTYKSMNIIEVAYEVGFNNKVTFNKSFKKFLSQTPSQYILSLEA